MRWPTIYKIHEPREIPNLLEYEQARADFSWDEARAELDGLPGGGGLNIAHEAVDRHALGIRRDKVALRFLRKNAQVVDMSYGQLRRESNRFADSLASLGIGPGDRVFTLLGRVPELYVAAIGTLKNKSVLCPLVTAFGPEPIAARLQLGDARVLVTTETLYRKKIQGLRSTLPLLEQVLLVGEPSTTSLPPRTQRLAKLMASANCNFLIPETDPEDMALLHFTSDSTGPKGAIHTHAAVVAHHMTGRLALDLHENDVFWCTAAPGWAAGTSYGIIAPLCCGVTNIVDEADFNSEHAYRLLSEQRVSVWYTTPTAIRMLMRAGDSLPEQYQLESLRFVACFGEALSSEEVVWGADILGRPLHDTWWQTETGAIMIANFAGLPVEPGSMGRPLPGIEAAIGRRTDDGLLQIIDDVDIEGELALRCGWPSMFRGYLHDAEHYERRFVGDWYLTGDRARRDANDIFWYVGRTDDIIKSAGQLIGPAEVENALREHPAVAEAAAIGKPDSIAMETVKAFVVLNSGFEGSPGLVHELLGHACQRLGPAVAPREIEIVAELPHTRGGEIMRRLVKARELGLLEADISSLESGV